MSPENINPELIAQLEGENKAAKIRSIIYSIGLDQKVAAELGVAKNGKPLVKLSAERQVVIDPSAVDNILSGDLPCLFRHLESCFAGGKENVSAIALLNEPEFEKSIAANILPKAVCGGNEILTRLSGVGNEVIPCTYGSTSGLNFAEVMETVIIAKEVQKFLGKKTVVVFGTDGHESSRADDILEKSVTILPASLQNEFEIFLAGLGKTLGESRENAARELLANCPLSLETPIFIEETMLTAEIGDKFSLGKLLLLAKMAGSDPALFKGGGGETKSSRLLANISDTNELRVAVSNQRGEMGGFGYYAREAVLAADFSGAVIYPLKLTTHGNIYKILGRYGGLFKPETASGAILAPIQRHRIQTREQSLESADPCDVVVLAFLADKFPGAFAKLTEEFQKTCKVLTAEQARSVGTADVRFIIDEYFPL